VAELVIVGDRPLGGRVRVSGRKNSAVAAIPAALLASGPCVIENLPAIADVRTYSEILRGMGVRVEQLDEGVISIDSSSLHSTTAQLQLAKQIRASYYLLGALVARFGEATVGLPGGCDIGQRPIDQHIKGLQALGAEVTVEHGEITVRAEGLHGAHIYLDVASVGATINVMLASVLAEGVTVIENAAKEPHIVDVANFLMAMGARVVGAGTDIIKVTGTQELRGADHAIIPDEIEAATFAIAAAATCGDVVIENVVPKHLDPIVAKLREAGGDIEENGDWIRVRGPRRPQAVNVKTLPYPGFPTDAQQPMTVLLSVAGGTSMVTDTIWENRFKHVEELQRMGTNIKVQGRTAIIEGVDRLFGTSVHASDLRAGAALITAGLVAEGRTVISGVEHVDRGYENIAGKLAGLGAEVSRPDASGLPGSADRKVVHLHPGA